MSSPEITRLPIALIRRDGGTQIRAQISMDHAREYAEAMGMGAVFPPIDVRHDGRDHWVSDGFHRLMGAELAGAQEIDANVRPGTRRDAILDAVGANAVHGYRRTNADKRQAVMTLLDDPEWSTKSDREIARLCHVGADMVGRLRPPTPPRSVVQRQTPAKREVTRGGKVFQMDVAAINRERTSVAGPEPVPTRGSVQLRTLLGELRAGADVKSAAIVAGIELIEGREHALAEARGEYADVVAIPPDWQVEGDRLPLTLTSGVVTDVDPALPSPAGDEPLPPSFDFEAAQRRVNVMQAITTIAAAPSPDEMAEMWRAHVGRGVPDEIVSRAAAWLAAFADLFPAAESARQRALTAMLEKL